MILLTLLLIPTLIAFGFFLFGGKKFTIGEFLGQNLAQLIFMSMLLLFNGFGNSSDVEVWNGRIEKKYSERVSCSHSYSCNCTTVCSGGKNNSCTTICQTCYEHYYDIDWVAKTNNDERIRIDRVSRQGLTEPARWTAIKVGEPTSLSHSYTNYVKASPDSLFRKQGLVDKYKDKLPSYPGNVYDYYNLDRLVLVNGAMVSDINQWNKDLKELNADIGHQKQVNIIVVLTKNMPDEYFYALEQAWIGSKKNDVVTLINLDNDNKITWVQVMAWTTDKLAEVVIKDNITAIGMLDREKIISSLKETVVKYYHRKSMSDFEYLKNTTTPSTTFWVVSMILGFLLSIGLGIFFLTNDYDEPDENFSIFKKGDGTMSTLTKVLLGGFGVLLLLGLVTVSSVVGMNNTLVSLEAGLTAQYKQNQNNYDNMVKKVMEVAQVPDMATSDLEKLTKAAISGRYGANGSKAVFQFIKEQNPTIATDLYTKVQQVIESGRNSFEADQKVLLDKKRIYETSLNSFPANVVAKFLGFPKIDLAKIDIVTSDRTDKAFNDKKDEAIKLRK